MKLYFFPPKYFPQDQDLLGGGFDASQAFAGKLSDMFWLSVELSAEQVLATFRRGLAGGIPPGLSSTDVIVSWETLLQDNNIEGAVTKTNPGRALWNSALHQVEMIRLYI